MACQHHVRTVYCTMSGPCQDHVLYHVGTMYSTMSALSSASTGPKSWCACVQDTVIEEDKEFVTQYFDMPDTDFADMERMSPWLLRIELNREMLTDKGLNMSRIADTITSEFGDEMSVIFTDDNAPKHILRVRLLSPSVQQNLLSACGQLAAQLSVYPQAFGPGWYLSCCICLQCLVVCICWLSCVMSPMNATCLHTDSYAWRGRRQRCCWTA